MIYQRMIKISITSFSLLVLFYWITKCNSLKIDQSDPTSFCCSFDNKTSTLVIVNCFKEDDVIECLKANSMSQTLVFSDSGLKIFPNYLHILSNLVNLNLTDNEISRINFTSLKKICKNLKQLNLNNNKIRILRQGDLDCLESLEKFYIAHNTLSLIENGTFNDKLKALNYIHLVHNNLTKLDTSLLSQILLTSKIRIAVNASWNRINNFTNSINITIRDISYLTSIHIVLTHNNFTTFDMNYFLKMLNITQPFPQLLNLWNCGFDVRFNPFICDCALYPLAKDLRTFHYMDPDNPVFSITCGTPKSLEGMLVRKVLPDQFNCSVTKGCPDSCTCTKTIAIDLITVYCGVQYHADDLPMICPVGKIITINMKALNMISLSSRAYIRNVTVLDVSQCAISNVDPSIVKTLEDKTTRSIYLNDNKLKTIPKTFEKFKFSKGQVLSINGNPFTCDCHTIWMKKWLLLNKEHVINQDKVLCATGPGQGVPMIEVPDSEYECQKQKQNYLRNFVIIFVVSFISIISMFIIVCFKIKRIKVYMRSNFKICKYCCRKKVYRQKKYDIFIGHTDEDAETVEIIKSELESHNPRYRVFIELDLKAGRPLSDNIEMMDLSHITLLVISNNFLQNPQCVMEFRQAHKKDLAKSIDLELIIMGNLKDELVIPELKLYLEHRTYTKYSVKHFWGEFYNKLPIIIPRKIGEETPLLEPK